MFAAPSSSELSTRHMHTRPRGEGQGDCKWMSKNRTGLNPVELEDALAALPVDTDSHCARKSENDTPSRCSELRETSESIIVNQDMVEDTPTTSDKRRGSLLQCLERCDSNSSFASSSPTPKRKISDYFTPAPKPKWGREVCTCWIFSGGGSIYEISIYFVIFLYLLQESKYFFLGCMV